MSNEMTKQIIPKEIIPKEIELLIYEKFHNINYAEVMKELTIKIGLENLEINYNNAVNYTDVLDMYIGRERLIEKNRLLRERLNAIDDNFIQTHFQYCIDCNCCEIHTKNRPVSLNPEDNLLTSKKYIQKLKKNDIVSIEDFEEFGSKCYCRCRYYARELVELTTLTYEILERNHRLNLICKLNEQLSRLKKLLRLSKLLQGPRTHEPEPIQPEHSQPDHSPVFHSRYFRIKRVRRELTYVKLEISRINIILNNHERLHTVSKYEFRDDRKFKENFKGFF